MKKLVLILAFVALSATTFAQTFTPDVVINGWKSKKDSSLKATPLRNGLGDFTVAMTLRTPALQLTFTQVQKVDDGWRLTTPIYIGYSYIYTYANGVVHQDSSITVENKLFFGGGLNFGVTPTNTGTLIGSVPVGAIVGYSKYGAFAGIDVLTGKPLFAISINLLNVPILQSTTRFTIKD